MSDMPTLERLRLMTGMWQEQFGDLPEMIFMHPEMLNHIMSEIPPNMMYTVSRGGSAHPRAYHIMGLNIEADADLPPTRIRIWSRRDWQQLQGIIGRHEHVFIPLAGPKKEE